MEKRKASTLTQASFNSTVEEAPTLISLLVSEELQKEIEERLKGGNIVLFQKECKKI